MGGQVEEDFLFLLPTGPDGQLVLHAYMACFPAGFDWADVDVWLRKESYTATAQQPPQKP